MLRNASRCKETKGRFCLRVIAKGDLLVVAISYSFKASRPAPFIINLGRNQSAKGEPRI